MIQSKLIKIFIVLIASLFLLIVNASTQKTTMSITPLNNLPVGSSADKDAIIYLEADNVDYDHKNGIINYQGNVHATQGSTQLNAQKMIVSYNPKNKIDRILAIGDLAQYQSRLNNDKDMLKASAKMIYYFPLANKVVLKDNALVQYNNSQFSGPFIFYDIKNKVISSHPKQNSQTKIILEPINQLRSNL